MDPSFWKKRVWDVPDPTVVVEYKNPAPVVGATRVVLRHDVARGPLAGSPRIDPSGNREGTEIVQRGWGSKVDRIINPVKIGTEADLAGHAVCGRHRCLGSPVMRKCGRVSDRSRGSCARVLCQMVNAAVGRVPDPSGVLSRAIDLGVTVFEIDRRIGGRRSPAERRDTNPSDEFACRCIVALDLVVQIARGIGAAGRPIQTTERDIEAIRMLDATSGRIRSRSIEGLGERSGPASRSRSGPRAD